VRLLLRAGRDREAAREQARFDRDAALTASIQAALSANPEKVESLQWVAYAYERLGLLHLADAHYRQLLARHPDDPRVTTALHRIRRQAASQAPGRRRSLE
jgi:Flp pilus assembly protein TadD